MLTGRPTASRLSRLLSEFGAASASGCALLALDTFSVFLHRESTLVHHLQLEFAAPVTCRLCQIVATLCARERGSLRSLSVAALAFLASDEHGVDRVIQRLCRQREKEAADKQNS